MQELQMSENYNDFKCIEKHNQMVTTILIDQKINKKERFLCQECLDNKLQIFESLSLNAMQKIIQDKLIKKRTMINNIADSYIQIIQKYLLNLEQLKTNLTSAIEMMINVTQNWIRELNQKTQDSYFYSFIDESDEYIRNTRQYMHTFSFDFFDKINSSQFNKLKKGIKQLIEAHGNYQYKEFFTNLRDIKEKRKQIEIVNWQLSKDGNIQLKQVSNPIMQNEMCNALAFNSLGTILVTSNNKEIVVWNFNQGKLDCCQKYQLPNIINCLVFSKYQNIFISATTEINCWKEQQKNQWEKSQAYGYSKDQKHPEITCLVLNQKEDKIIQGSKENIINIWAADFQNNQLLYLYSLNKHCSWVSALSLNNSENLLVSCGYGNQALIWKKEQDNKWNFMTEITKFQKFNNSCKALFIKDDQFVFLAADENFTSASIFQQNKKDFNKIYEIQFKITPKIIDSIYQSFEFKPERNLLFVRYKDSIYLLRKQKDEKYKIAYEQRFQTNEIYGTLSKTGQYLVIFDKNTKSYNTYQLQDL